MLDQEIMLEGFKWAFFTPFLVMTILLLVEYFKNDR